jgi:putative ATPase
LIEAGDETSIVRRLKVIAFEDIGIASQETVNFVCNACDSVKELGFPEARIPLANAVVALCLSSKSNSSYKALDSAIDDIKNGNIGEIPKHLKDAHYASASLLGNGVGYKYPHDYPLGTFGGWTEQQYLPDLLKNKQYYHPIEAGQEKNYKQIYEKLNQFKNKNN